MRLHRARTALEDGSPDGLGVLPLVVGSGVEATARIDGASVAPLHLRVQKDSVEAIEACTVGDVPLEAGRKRLLVPFVTLLVGDVLLYVADDDAEASLPTRDLVLGALDDSATLWPSVVVVEGPSRGAQLVLREDRAYSVGRSAEADLQLDAPTISRLHLDLRRLVGERGVRVRDRGATRGTFLGRARLASDREAVWTPHTMIRVGECVLALRVPGFSEPPAIGDTLQPGANAPPPDRLVAASTAAAIAEVPQLSPVGVQRKRRVADLVTFGVLTAIAVVMVAALVWLLAS